MQIFKIDSEEHEDNNKDYFKGMEIEDDADIENDSVEVENVGV